MGWSGKPAAGTLGWARHPVAVLVAVALALRLATLTWGMSLGAASGWYHPDESKVWSSVVGFPHNYLTNPTFIYGTALQYTIGTLLYPFKRLWAAGHSLLPISYRQFAVLAIRLFHAMLGAATVALLYQLALRLWDRSTALLSAALLSVCFLHVLNSALTTLDVPMGFLVVLGALLAARASDSLRTRDFLVLGVVLGYLAGTKVTGAALAVVPIVLAVTAPRSERRRWIVGTAIVGSVIIAVFALSTPHVVLHPRAYLASMAHLRMEWVNAVRHTPSEIVRVWLKALTIALMPAVAVLALIGLAIGRAAPAARRLEFALLAYLATQVLIWRAYLPSRFLLPIAPILCAYAARSLVLMSRGTRPWLRRAAPAVTTLVLISTLAAVLVGIWVRWHDPRTEAAQAIRRLVPEGSRVGFASRVAPGARWARAMRGTGVIMSADSEIQDTRWLFPTVDAARYRITSGLARPAFLVINDWTPGLNWFPGGVQPPTPEEFHAHDELLRKGWGYVQLGYWGPASRLPVEQMISSIGLYRLEPAAPRDSVSESQLSHSYDLLH